LDASALPFICDTSHDQSQDAALTAVQVFNSPLIKFKPETFIVLMNIAWTYLLHASRLAIRGGT
jgi:hypothetical protein